MNHRRTLIHSEYVEKKPSGGYVLADTLLDQLYGPTVEYGHST
jgi:hypothetical protein